MGNCLKHASSVSQYSNIDDDEEDWECSAAHDAASEFPVKDIGGGGKTTEVKIKITKKQLEALLAGKVDLRVEQLLAQLVTHSDRFQAHQRPWRPALQSIPEVN